MAGSSMAVRDVTDADFQQEVIEHSKQVPVVVDFWAAWCGPCRMLGPVLEKLAGEADGAWELVKVDTDANPGVAAQYRIQSIPAVKAFRNGEVVDEFTGALPEARVREWLNNLAPSAADQGVTEARAAEARGDLATAEAGYQAVLAENRRHPEALLGLARMLATRGDASVVEAILADLPPDLTRAQHSEAEALRARLRFMTAAATTDRGAVQAALVAQPRDAGARLNLGVALAGDSAWTEALDELLESVRIDRRYGNDAARKAMLDIFGILGDDDARTQEYRRKLSAVLF